MCQSQNFRYSLTSQKWRGRQQEKNDYPVGICAMNNKQQFLSGTITHSCCCCVICGENVECTIMGDFNTSLIPKLSTRSGNNHIVLIIEVKYCNEVKTKFNLASNPFYGYRNRTWDDHRNQKNFPPTVHQQLQRLAQQNPLSSTKSN